MQVGWTQAEFFLGSPSVIMNLLRWIRIYFDVAIILRFRFFCWVLLQDWHNDLLVSFVLSDKMFFNDTSPFGISNVKQQDVWNQVDEKLHLQQVILCCSTNTKSANHLVMFTKILSYRKECAPLFVIFRSLHTGLLLLLVSICKTFSTHGSAYFEVYGSSGGTSEKTNIILYINSLRVF